MEYIHLRGKGFQEGPAGPVIYRANVMVPLTANVQDYQVEENSPIERNYLVGLWVTDPAVSVSGGNSVAASTIFNSIALTFRVEESDVVRKVYAHQIKKANDNGKPYYLFLPGRINLSETTIECFNNSSIPASTVFEFQAEYAKK